MQMMAQFDEFVFVSICVCLTVIVGVSVRLCVCVVCVPAAHVFLTITQCLYNGTFYTLPPALCLCLCLCLCVRAELKLKPIWAKTKSVFDV